MKRNRAIDYEKGFIVAAMVFAHVLAYFGKFSEYPEQSIMNMVVNALAFSTFIFAYGRSVFVAYYSRDFRTAAPKMLGSALRSYLAFCISGISNNILVQEKNFSLNVVKRVVLLEDIPSMSEFLAAFALAALVALVLFKPLKALLEHKKAYLVVTFALLLSTFIPYGMIHNVYLGLLIGMKKFYLFPVLQYFPWFMLGLYVARYGMEKKGVWIGVSALCTAAGAAYSAIWGQPGRFPPTLLWIIMPAFVIVLLNLLAEAMERGAAKKTWAAKLMHPIESMGCNSLYYLVTSNLILFSLTNMNRLGDLGSSVLPYYRDRAKFPFNLATGSTPWALFWTLVMLLGIGFVGSLYRKPRKG